METITVPLIWGTAREPRCLDVCGERLLIGRADTGIFKIVDVGGRPAGIAPPPRARDEDDPFAFATIEFDGRLEVAERNADGDPYNRSGRRMR